ncbi:MAG: hypothetical protein [Bacteriophage sp.]|nr:MAG: hypothetical protein [Bacteriophage sp.]
MAVNINHVIGWFDTRKGNVTYSMYGSRNGTDGTADCSGSITQAIRDAGGKAYNYLYSTVTLAPYLAVNGFKRIAKNQDWDAQAGDIVMMSWGNDMASSGGAGGHVGIMKSPTEFISCDYWTGGQQGTAISEHQWEDYYATEVAKGLQYVEVWRLVGGPISASDVKVPVSGSVDQVLNVGEHFKGLPAYRVDRFEYVNNVEQVISYKLANGGHSEEFDWTNNGLGILSIDKVDENGNLVEDQRIDVGDYFRLHSDRIEVVDVDPATNGVAFGTRYGNIWASAESLTEVE